MRIKPGKNGYVEGYAAVGDIEGSVAFHGEIPEGFKPETCRCYRLIEDALVPDPDKLASIGNDDAMQDELAALHSWFTRYDTQVMQYLRAVRLGQASKTDISELDEQAQKNQARINEIKTALIQE